MIVEWVKFVRYSCDISFEWKKYLIASFPVSESTVTRLFLIFFPKSQMQPVLNICLNFTPLQLSWKRIVYSICQRRTRRNGFHYPLQFFLAFEKISVSAFRSLRSTYGYRLLYSTQGFFLRVQLLTQGELSSIWLYFEQNSRMSDKKIQPYSKYWWNKSFADKIGLHSYITGSHLWHEVKKRNKSSRLRPSALQYNARAGTTVLHFGTYFPYERFYRHDGS